MVRNTNNDFSPPPQPLFFEGSRALYDSSISKREKLLERKRIPTANTTWPILYPILTTLLELFWPYDRRSTVAAATCVCIFCFQTENRGFRLNKQKQMTYYQQHKKGLNNIFCKFHVQDDRITCKPLCKNNKLL